MRSILCILLASAVFLPVEVVSGESLSQQLEPKKASYDSALLQVQGEPLTLSDALDTALQNNPRLAAWGHQVAADEALLQGDEAYPNPELEVDVEDFLGSGEARGVDALQVTASLSQEVQLGGKPGARREVKTARKEISNLEYQIKKQLLMADVATAFLEVLAHERRLANAQEVELLAAETVRAFEYQVEAGRGAPIEVDKAAIVFSLASLAREQAQRARHVGRQRLAAVCGKEQIFFGELVGSLETIAPLLSLDALLERIESSPTVMARAAELRHKKALFELARANRVPDISFSLGYRWMNAAKDSALVAGVAIPLPFVNRNQGPIGAAAELRDKSGKESEHQRIQLVRELIETYHLLAIEQKRATVLRKEIYPRAEATFEAVREGYRIGRFGYLDLLDAQRTLFEIKEQALEALIAYQRTAVQIARIAALPISPDKFTERKMEENQKERTHHDQ